MNQGARFACVRYDSYSHQNLLLMQKYEKYFSFPVSDRVNPMSQSAVTSDFFVETVKNNRNP